MTEQAAYYTTGTTNTWMAVAVVLFAAWTLWASRHYRTPAQEAVARATHPTLSGVTVLGPTSARCATCGFIEAPDGYLDSTPGSDAYPCERCLWDDE